MERKVFGVVYLIWCKVNGKRYVGQTVQPLQKRFNAHAKCKKNMPISRAIRKYGKENFYCGVIKSCASKEELDYWEKFYIVALKSKNRKIGYNLTDGGEGTAGLEFTPEHRAHLSAALSGDKNPHYGKKNTPEHTARIVAANLGRKRKPGTGENIAAALRGKPFTKERCAHISAAKRSESPYKNLVAELDARNLSYAALARLMGATPNVVSRKMNCVRNFTDADKAKLVEIFGKTIDYLLERDDTIAVPSPKYDKKLYKNLLNEMDNQYINKTALAELLGLSKRSLFGKMRGEYNFNDAEKAKLVEIFGKPIEYLLERKDD